MRNVPIPINELPTRTVIATLPNVTVPGGGSRTSPYVSVPVGAKSINALVDGSGWPANTQLSVFTELTNDNGATIITSATSTHTNTGSASNTYGTGYLFNVGGNVDANLKIRATITVTSGAAITLVGDVGVT